MTWPARLHVLAFSAYHGGSHAQFLEEWAARSRHTFQLVTLPPRHFKWRMRQASVGMAQAATTLNDEGAQFDIIWTTSMLDAAELIGLLPRPLRSLPLLVYFHENQLLYPVRKEDQRNQHFSLINWVSALAADAVWFNSAFNRDSMLSELRHLLKKMPDENCLDSLAQIRDQAHVEPLGIVRLEPGQKTRGPLHLAWVGRWEHDKRPDLFFSALRQLRKREVPFRLTVLGQRFRSAPPEFEGAQEEFKDCIEQFGFAEDRTVYERLLQKCDVVISTATHEFFGVALLEAVSAGAVPLVPNRLVYPELYPPECLYEREEDLVERLVTLAQKKQSESTLGSWFEHLRLDALLERFDFRRRAPQLDDALEQVWNGHSARSSGQPRQYEDEEEQPDDHLGKKES